MLYEYFEETGSLFKAIVLSILNFILTIILACAPIGIFIWLINQQWFLDFISTHFV